MHELSLAEGVVQVVEDAARQQGFSRVATIWLEIGQLAAVDVEALRFCFEDVARGTVADAARLEIGLVPGEAWCPACCATIAISELIVPCPHCGAYGLKPTAGTGMRVAEMDVL